MAGIESTQAQVAEPGDVLVPIEARALLGLPGSIESHKVTPSRPN